MRLSSRSALSCCLPSAAFTRDRAVSASAFTSCCEIILGSGRAARGLSMAVAGLSMASPSPCRKRWNWRIAESLRAAEELVTAEADQISSRSNVFGHTWFGGQPIRCDIDE